MNRFACSLILLAMLTPSAWAQNKSAAKRGDPCAPIGKTSDGRFVYSLSCDVIPTPVIAPRPAAEAVPVAPVPPPEEEDKGGLFRNPFPSIIRPTNVERNPGVGPSGGR